jgi:hypothetical protein
VWSTTQIVTWIFQTVASSQTTSWYHSRKCRLQCSDSHLFVYVDPLISTEFCVPPHAVVIFGSVGKIRVIKDTVANAANVVD